MLYTTLPGTDLHVSSLCLGTADFGSTIDESTAFRMLDSFLDSGGNFIDTAKIYADWLPGERSISEKTIGRWLRQSSKRHRIILATKGAHPHLETMLTPRLSRAEILSDLDASLRHLGVEVIDLYWLHRDDPNRPVAEILETLNEAVRQGKIRAFGCSNWRVERIRAALETALAHRLVPFIADQMFWNLALVDPRTMGDSTLVAMDEPLRRYHNETGLAAIPYSSQANGFFNKMARGQVDALNPLHRQMYLHAENLARFQRADQLCRETGLSITQVVLGYLLSQPFPTVPIIGPRTLEQLADSLSAAEIRLTPEQIRTLEQGASRELPLEL
ncbi:predicted oxidoreductase related to aryl-alcohol dehydrogenases [Anaerolinea thermolimosa]|uniref:aldo/keto reductase n=1 Tax=Anaerolinea thermolimosa TaxID=229919 RepID=UPI0013B3CEC2|nr:aldo/keto reductase [Anaerolinea thermolimosa]GAP07793.1 predicted oxidoreductase related to aryl-alcohol dehydrogenases [Anaerolinea thermolimosa]